MKWGELYKMQVDLLNTMRTEGMEGGPSYVVLAEWMNRVWERMNPLEKQLANEYVIENYAPVSDEDKPAE